MPEILISGIPVNFPFEPYEVQRQYMTKVIDCLQTGKNGILESPTGTGKTLCLLCATLAWVEMRKAQIQARTCTGPLGSTLQDKLKGFTGVTWDDVDNAGVPKIIYSSRTHTQLSQALRELKRSDYKHVKATILGSREQLCLHPEVVKESNSGMKIHMCRVKVANRTCHFFNNTEAALCTSSIKQNPVVDIEDMVNLGTKHNCCPYYVSKSLKVDADIIFMPYNYLLDSKAQQAHGLDLKGNIIIFDEAHNVEKMCEESASIDLRSHDIATCISEVTQIMQQVAALQQSRNVGAATSDWNLVENTDFTVNDLCVLKTLLIEIEEEIEYIMFPGNTNCVTRSGDYMRLFFSKVNLCPEKKAPLLELLDKLIQYLAAGSTNGVMRRGRGLQKFADVVRIVFSEELVSNPGKYYRVYISLNDQGSKKKEKGDLWTVARSSEPKFINYWCFNPAIGMRNVLGKSPRSVILTSGTLSPVETFASELGLSLPVQLVNPHIVQKSQIWVGIVKSGPDGTLLDTSYKNRSDLKFITSLGSTIVNYSRVVPGGLLVFFPSYIVMAECQKVWESTNMWQSITNHKAVFVENQQNRNIKDIMKEFYEKNGEMNGQGAIFMAVCRGKVSEGLDFSDHNGRAVIIVGLPFSPWMDPKVKLKMSYLDDQLKEKKTGVRGGEWYKLDAYRAVNQAIGRVIRHKDDYGAIILCDRRFDDMSLRMKLSKWLQPHIQVYPDFGSSLRSLTQFFKNIENVNRGCKLKPSLTRSDSGSSVQLKESTSLPTGKQTNINGSVRSVTSSYVHASRTLSSEDSFDWDSQKSGYQLNKSEDSKSASTSAGKGLFDLLDSHQNQQTFTGQSKRDMNENDGAPILPTFAKKRKLNVIGPRQFFEMKQQSNIASLNASVSCISSSVTPGSGKSITTEANVTIANTFSTAVSSRPGCGKNGVCSQSENPSREAAAKFLICMRKNLTQDTYAKFKSAMMAYNSQKDLPMLTNTLSEMDDGSANLEALIRDFRQFIRKADKQEYDTFIQKQLGKTRQKTGNELL